MTLSAEQKAERDARKVAIAVLNKRLEAEARQYALLWCNPAAYRQHWQQEWTKNVAAMRAQRLARIRRRDAMLAWLIRYESWREEHGRPISYAGSVPERVAQAA